MPRKPAPASTGPSSTPRQGGKVKDTSRKDVRSTRNPRRGQAASSKTASRQGERIDVPPTTRQERRG